MSYSNFNIIETEVLCPEEVNTFYKIDKAFYEISNT